MIRNMCYWIYATLFWCQRGIMNTLFQEEETPKKSEIKIAPPKHPWIYIAAVMNESTEIEVTKIVDSVVTPSELLTPARLSEITGIATAIRWEYLSISTFEVQTISSEGLVNEVEWKSD